MTGTNMQKLLVVVVVLLFVAYATAQGQSRCPPKSGDVYTLGVETFLPWGFSVPWLAIEHAVNLNSLAGRSDLPCFSFNISLFEGGSPSSDTTCAGDEDANSVFSWYSDDNPEELAYNSRYNCDRRCLPRNSITSFSLCNDWGGAKAARDLLEKDRIVGVLGVGCSDGTLSVAKYLKQYEIPLVSAVATVAALSNTEEYPNFFRTISSDTGRAQALADIADNFGITAASIITTTDSYPAGLANDIEAILEDLGIDVKSKQLLKHDKDYQLDDAELDVAFQRLKDDGVKAIFAPAYCPFMKIFYRKAVEYGLTADDCILWFEASGSLSRCFPDFPDMFTGMVGVGETVPGLGYAYSNFKQFWYEQDPCLFRSPIFRDEPELHHHSSEIYDAVLVYAIAIQRLVDAGTPVTGANIIAELEKDDFSFEGLTGTVTFGGDFDPPIGPHDRAPWYPIRAFDGYDWVNVGTWSAVEDDPLSFTKRFIFPGGSYDFSKCLNS